MTEASTVPQYSFRYRLEAAAARTLFGLLARLSIDTASAIGGWMGRAFGPLTGAHRTAEKNLRRAMPELSDAERASVLHAAWDNFGRTMTEYGALERLRRGDRITVEGAAPLAALAKTGSPAIICSAHLGNWELAPVAMETTAKPLFIVYRAANNPLVDRLIADLRSSYTDGMAPKGTGGARQIVQALKSGGHVLMLMDQKINTGVEIPFFGHGAFTGPAIVRMAARFNCPVFPLRVERLEGCRFKVVVEEPWTFTDDSDEGVRAALISVNQRLESWIRAKPGQWLWMHKRWPQ